MIAPRVALSKDFMAAYSQLPKKQQKKTREFIEKFQHDPTQPGINFERVGGAADDKVRSVRVDQTYRAIVIHPPKGDVYLCVWVDHHDEAYKWVRNKRFEVNPSSGSFQLFEMVEGMGAAEPKPIPTEEISPPAPALFDGFDDEELILIGVPVPLLATVRSVTSDDELDKLAPHLPEAGAEMLYLLGSGFSVLDAIEEADRTRVRPRTVDTDDFVTALATPESQRLFKIVENERELEKMLEAPLEQWRIFLHPSQRELVTMETDHPVRVLGSAGTGKTVVLMHRARHLAATVFNSQDDQILVTSYSSNLAADLRANLSNLCDAEAFARLEITNLHKWASQFLRKHGQALRPASNADRRRLLSTAMAQADSGARPASFYKEEWDKVVQPQEVSSLDDYLSTRRVGRGTRLNRRDRTRVWGVLHRFRELLDEAGLSDWQDLIRETRLYIEKQHIPLPYRAVLADEVQDFTPSGLKLLRAIAPKGQNTLFLVGDAHQRIWGQPSRLGTCGIEIAEDTRRLILNYRTTEQIRNRAVAVLEGCEIDDLDGSLDSLKAYRSLRQGPPPDIRSLDSEASEAAAVVSQLQAWLSAGVKPEAICVSARTNDYLNQRYQPLIENAGIKVAVVESSSESKAGPGVRLATMHRMKGLEFSRVLLVGAQDGQVPLRLHELPDEASRQDHELQEKCLLYVALTRARDEVVVMGFGKPSPFLIEGTQGAQDS